MERGAKTVCVKTMSKQEAVTIIIPMPPKWLSPNKPVCGRGARMRHWRCTQKQKKLAKEAVIAEGIESGPWQKVETKATFFHKQERRRDGSNFNAMLKGAFDGIVEAGLVVDDDHKHWTTLPPEFFKDKEFSRVEIVVTRIK